MKKESTSSLPDKFIDGLPVQVYTSPVPFAFLEFKHFAVNNMLSVSIFWSSKKKGSSDLPKESHSYKNGQNTQWQKHK